VEGHLLAVRRCAGDGQSSVSVRPQRDRVATQWLEGAGEAVETYVVALAEGVLSIKPLNPRPVSGHSGNEKMTPTRTSERHLRLMLGGRHHHGPVALSTQALKAYKAT